MSEQFVSARPRRRWSDNDYHFGPFTFARDDWKSYCAVLSSGSHEHEDPGCNIRFKFGRYTAICELPQLIKPWRAWVDLRGKEWAKSDGYWDEHRRKYGLSLSDGFLHVYLGAQTMDSATTQDWGWHLPWMQQRQVAHRIYDIDGNLVADLARMPWQQRFGLRDGLEKARFTIADYDGERIEAETYVEEWEWRRGTGLFCWLGYITPKRHCRTLEIKFNKEVGRDKGSWKGGMIGTSIEMLPGETQEQAFRRFCDEEHRSKHGRYRVAFLPSHMETQNNE